MYRKRNQMRDFLICIMDLNCVLISFALAGIARFDSFAVFIRGIDIPSALVGIFLIFIISFYGMRIYDGMFSRGVLAEITKIIQFDIVFTVGLTAYIFSTKNVMELSRLTGIYMAIFNFLLILIAHELLKQYRKYFYSKPGKASKVVVMTSLEEAENVIKVFSETTEKNCDLCGLILIESDIKRETINGIPIVGNFDNYLDYVKNNIVDEVFIHLTDLRKNEIMLKRIIFELEQMGIVVQLNINLFDFGVADRKRVYRWGEYYVIAFSTRFFDYRLMTVKRIMDIIGGLVGLLITGVFAIFLAPILLLESKGPLIFKQKRVGKNGRIFEFYKFRSMYQDAEERKAELMAQNEMVGGMFKMKNDPRITKVGKFIRATSIDELPQFWNVLKGDMSLVGTRPPTVDEYEKYESHHKRRISLKPGITGLWQISGRSNIKDFEAVVELDLQYIDNWTIGLDIKILLLTVGAVFKGIGAR